MSADRPTCATCRWFTYDGGEQTGDGTCRSHAPRARWSPYGGGSFPVVRDRDWCSEHASVMAEPNPIPWKDVMQAQFDFGPCPDHPESRLQLSMYGKPACLRCLSSVIDHDKARAWAAPEDSPDAR